MMSFALRLALVAAMCGLAAPAASAFTMDTVVPTTTPDGSTKYVDSDRRFSDTDKSKNTIKQGNTTIQFNSRPSFDQQFNTNNYFEPSRRLENER